jgi:sialidase-1
MKRREFVVKGLSFLGSMVPVCSLSMSISSGSETHKSQRPSGRKAGWLLRPEVFLAHTAEREFIGPAVLEVRKSRLWMIAPWGRPPVDFRQVKRFALPPHVYESTDEGKTWQKGDRLNMRWELPGIISDGGITLLRLQSGRLMASFHRNVYEYHGGGVPAISYSEDEGRSWSPARRVQEREEVFYLMNERTIQLRSGRLVIPVALRPADTPVTKYIEGNVCLAGCFLSDDEGKSWRMSKTVSLEDKRGMQEPAVAELSDGGILMLARTGSGSHHACFSRDGGQSWTEPRPTMLTAACSPLTLKRMPNGHLLLAYNPATPLFEGSFFPRRPLSYSVSRDDGKSWSTPVVIDDVSRQQLIYPSITFLKGGILVVYSAHFDRGDGKFYDNPDAYKVGGGKRGVFPYPA